MHSPRESRWFVRSERQSAKSKNRQSQGQKQERQKAGLVGALKSFCFFLPFCRFSLCHFYFLNKVRTFNYFRDLRHREG